jgi:hypothetical protein
MGCLKWSMMSQALGGVNSPCSWYRVRGQLPSTGGRDHTHTHMHTLLPDLEAIKQVMVEKKGANLKAKGKGSTAPSKAKGNPKRKRQGAQLVKSLRRVAVRSFANSARLMADPSRPTTPWTAVAATAMVSPSWQQQVSPLSPRSPTRSLGVIRAWPSCSPC